MRRIRGGEPFSRGKLPAVKTDKHATLNDVARDAGVSYQTVSRVINDHPHVADGTRERVRTSITKLGYVPNPIARGLVTRRSNTVGIVVFGAAYYGPAQMVVNVDRALKDRGYALTMTVIDEPTFAKLSAAVQTLKLRHADGLVIIAAIRGIDLDRLEDVCGTTPYVMVDAALGISSPSVVIDQREGGQLSARHLIDLGHRRIAEISGPLAWNDAYLRHEGFLEAIERSGLAPGPSVESDWSALGGFRSTIRLLERHGLPDALVIGNDQMALGAIHALKERGLRVPDDVSIVGFDDVPEAGFFDPPLTTVRQDFSALGRRSAEYLIRLIEGDGEPEGQVVLPPELVVRRSATIKTGDSRRAK